MITGFWAGVADGVNAVIQMGIIYVSFNLTVPRLQRRLNRYVAKVAGFAVGMTVALLYHIAVSRLLGLHRTDGGQGGMLGLSVVCLVMLAVVAICVLRESGHE